MYLILGFPIFALRADFNKRGILSASACFNIKDEERERERERTSPNLHLELRCLFIVYN